MKKLLLASLLALALAVPAASQPVLIPATTAQVPITGTIAAATRIVTGVAGKQIYVTAVMQIPVATSVVTYTTGTGSNCGTSTANVTGAMTFAAGQTLTLGDGYGAVWVLPAGFDLCVTIATAVAPGSLAYGIF
ncbi:MAG TPA: hypothetical protein VFV92_01075 [Candidatus Bathyarchaeia archaeon]|nr:hypothetical protein [Candidatus Bathyarchaeia archaeon]